MPGFDEILSRKNKVRNQKLLLSDSQQKALKLLTQETTFKIIYFTLLIIYCDHL